MLLIGLLSPNYLRRMPTQVVGAAGQNVWRKPISPTTRVLETAVDAGIDPGEAVDQEVHDWMTAVIEGETTVSEDTCDSVADLFLDLFL